MKKLVALALAMVMTMSLVACSTSSDDSADTSADTSTEAEDTADASDDSETYHFEIVSKGFQSTYWQAVYNGAVAELEVLNTEAGYEKYTMSFDGPASESDIASQVTMLTDSLSVSPDAIGLAALDTSALNDLITEAYGNNIPIVGFDSGVDLTAVEDGSVVATAATDNYAAGQVAADGLYEKVASRIGSEQVRIGVVNQDATAESIINRGIGFIDEIVELATADGYTVYITGNEKYVSDSVDSTGDEATADIIIDVAVPSQTTVELCATEASALLNKSDIIAIYGSNQVSAEGIVTANETLNVLGSDDDDIIAVGFDSGSVLKAAISAGTMYGAVTQSPVGIGTVLIDLLAASVTGGTVEDTDTGCAFYTAENIESTEIAQNLYD